MALIDEIDSQYQEKWSMHVVSEGYRVPDLVALSKQNPYRCIDELATVGVVWTDEDTNLTTATLEADGSQQYAIRLCAIAFVRYLGSYAREQRIVKARMNVYDIIGGRVSHGTRMMRLGHLKEVNHYLRKDIKNWLLLATTRTQTIYTPMT